VKNGDFYPWFKGQTSLLNQAQRQIAAADGTNIVWSVAEPKALEAIQNLFDDNGTTGIQLKNVAPEG